MLTKMDERGSTAYRPRGVKTEMRPHRSSTRKLSGERRRDGPFVGLSVDRTLSLSWSSELMMES